MVAPRFGVNCSYPGYGIIPVVVTQVRNPPSAFSLQIEFKLEMYGIV